MKLNDLRMRRDPLDLLNGRFSGVMERYRAEKGTEAPLFVALWPDSVCHQALMALVDDLNFLPTSVRFEEACYQFITHTAEMAQEGPWGLRVGSLRAALLKGPVGPSRQGQEERKARAVGEQDDADRALDEIQRNRLVEKRKGQGLAALDGASLADLVRNLDFQTKSRHLPSSAAFVAAAAMIVLDQDMTDMAITEAESSFSKDAQVDRAPMGYSLLLSRQPE